MFLDFLMHHALLHSELHQYFLYEKTLENLTHLGKDSIKAKNTKTICKLNYVKNCRILERFLSYVRAADHLPLTKFKICSKINLS